MKYKSGDRRHRRRHSWPLGPLHKSRPVPPSINDNPFAHFISPVPEIQTYLFDYVDADIQPSSPTKAPRSRFGKIRRPLRRWRQRPRAQEVVTKIKVWVRRFEDFCLRRPRLLMEVETDEDAEPMLMLEQMCVVEARQDPEPMPIFTQRHFVARSIRNHSARPRSWIEPRPDLWTVVEEGPSEPPRSRSFSVIPYRSSV